MGLPRIHRVALLLCLYLLALTSANALDKEIQKRQSAPLGTGGLTIISSTSTTSTTTTTTPSDTSTPTSTTTTSTSNAPTTSNRPTSTTPTPGRSTTTTTPKVTSDVTSTTSTFVVTTTDSAGQRVTLTGSAASAVTERVTRTSALVATRTSNIVTRVTFVSAGRTFTSLHTTAELVTQTTGFATFTSSPTLSGDSSSSGGGLSANSKKVIGGVVGGIGGAIVIGAIAVVFWRLRRKRNMNERTESLMYEKDNVVGKSGHYRDSSLMSGSNEGTGLERYQRPDQVAHQPPSNVNTSSNF